MIVKHEGYTFTEIVGDASARVTETVGGGVSYVEIRLKNVSGTYDLYGLKQLIDDLSNVQDLAAHVDQCNGKYRENQE
jgi:hypothetical protein